MNLALNELRKEGERLAKIEEAMYGTFEEIVEGCDYESDYEPEYD